MAATAAAAAAAASMATVTPSCTGSSARAKRAAMQVSRVGGLRVPARQRAASRGFVKISAVAVNGAAPDVAQQGE